jgi:PST family polysaccharide transporter
VLTRTLFPGLLRFKDDIPKLRENTLNAVEAICTFSFPVAVGFAFVAPEAVLILYGSNWTEAIPIVQAVSLCIGIESIGASVTTSVAMATGQTKLLFRRSVVRSALRIPTFIIGAWLYGIPGALIGFFIGSVLFASANIGILKIMLETTYAELALRIWRALAAVMVMAGVLVVIDQYLGTPSSGWNAAYGLLLKTAAGMASYGLVRFAIWRITGQPAFSETIATTVLSAVATRLRLQK